MTQVQQNNIQDLDDLAAQVEELVGELSDACKKVSKRLSDDEPEDEVAAPEDRAELTEDDVEASAADGSDAAGTTDETAEDTVAEHEPHPAEQAIDELEQQLEDLIELGADAPAEPDTVVKPGASAKADGVAPPNAEDLGDLDQQIAALTDELLDGDFVDAFGESVVPAAGGDAPEPAADASGVSEPPAPDEAAFQDSFDDSSDDALQDEDEALAETRAEATGDAPAPEEPPQAQPAPKPAAARVVARPPTPESPGGPHPVVVVLLAAAKRTETTARTLADLASTPLKNKPKIVRDTVGWFGLWTLFLAVCVWITLAFFRSPDHPEAESEPMRIRTADESSAPRPANQRPLPHPENVRSAASPR